MFFQDSSKPEVSELDTAVAVLPRLSEEDVFHLEVPVHDAPVVAVLDSLQHLVQNVDDLLC